MTISAECGGCGRVYRVGDDKSGKRFKCKDCGQTILVRRTKKKREVSNDDRFDAPADSTSSRSAGLPPRSTRNRSKSRSNKGESNAPGRRLPLLVGGLLAVTIIVGGVFLSTDGDSEPVADQVGKTDDTATDDSKISKQEVSDTPAKASALSFKTRSDVPDQSWRRSPTPRSYPSLPDAIGALPAWLIQDKNAPFDVADYAAMPAKDDNAAPLYLDALYEFSREVENCFPDDERLRRSPIVRSRSERFYKLYMPWEKNRLSVNAAAFGAILKEYEIGFQKLRAAQQKPQCVFTTGVGFAALLPHVQSAREIARVATVRAWSELQKGNIDGAIQDAATTLRLGRDIAHRGVLISTLLTTAIDSVVCQNILRDVLLHRDLTTDQCDRLVAILAEQEKFHDTVWRSAWQGEYVGIRVALHDLQYRAGEFSPGAIKEFEIDEKTLQGRTWGQFAAGLIGSLAFSNSPSRLADHLDSMTDADFEREISMANAGFTSLLDVFERPIFERHKLASLIEKELTANGASKIISLFIGGVPNMAEAARRGSTRLAAFKSLVCIRRWQLEHSTTAPPDLATALKAAGITEPVVDGYGAGEPLRFTTINGKPVIYSIGPDGKDDKGVKEWTLHPNQPGDWTFRLESGSADESRHDAARRALGQ